MTEIYQDETFTVPSTTASSRLDFSADYPYSGQTSLLHFALVRARRDVRRLLAATGSRRLRQTSRWPIRPLERGRPSSSRSRTARPRVGSGLAAPCSGTPRTYQYAAAGKVSPSTLDIAAGKSKTVTITVTSPKSAGDTQQSVVLSTTGAGTTTIPVTIRTMIPITKKGGTFSGVLTGGNGRGGAPAQENTYAFDVPKGESDLDASVTLSTDPSDELIAYLVDPDGQTVGYFEQRHDRQLRDAGIDPVGEPVPRRPHGGPVGAVSSTGSTR